jgi:mannose-1-phosphate guanylyltransferase
MILAAGLGTRLRPLTAELPKPLVPVGDRPVLAHVAAQLARAGIRDAAVNTYHLADAFTEAVLASLPLALHVLHEHEILGTAGGIANAAATLGDEAEVVVWNGDVVTNVDVGALIEARRARGAAAVLAVSPRAGGEGNVGIGKDGRVVRLRGERFGDEIASGDFICIQVIAPALRATFPRQGCLMDDGYRPALRRGELVTTFTVDGPWDDVGSIAAYLAANARWLAREKRSAYVHESARVAPGVVVENSVIGAGAEVRGEGAVRGCVVWPGARAVAPLQDAVVTPRGVVATRT